MPPLNMLVISGVVTHRPKARFAADPALSTCRLTLQVDCADGAADESLFIGITVVGRVAELAAGLHPGSRICLNGRLHFRLYREAAGMKRGAIEVLADGLAELAPGDAVSAARSEYAAVVAP